MLAALTIRTDKTVTNVVPDPISTYDSRDVLFFSAVAVFISTTFSFFLFWKSIILKKAKFLGEFFSVLLGKYCTYHWKVLNKSLTVISISITSLSESSDWFRILEALWFLIMSDICIVFPVPWMIKLENEITKLYLNTWCTIFM